MNRTYVNQSLLLPEIFDRVRQINDKEEQVKFLRLFANNVTLQWYVNCMYNVDFSNIKSSVFKQYKPSEFPIGNCARTMTSVKLKLINAYKLYNSGKQQHADKLMRDSLETVHASEAELIVTLFTGKKLKGISKTILKEVFPQFFRFQESV